MVVDTEKLKEEIKKRGMTVPAIANKLRLNPSTLYRKLQNGGESFTVGEAAQITDILSLSSKKANEIFFGD